MSVVTPEPEPTDSEVDAAFEALAESASAPAGVEVRFSLEIGGVKYGGVEVLPAGFPEIYNDANLRTQFAGAHVGSIIANTFYRHFYPEENTPL